MFVDARSKRPRSHMRSKSSLNRKFFIAIIEIFPSIPDIFQSDRTFRYRAALMTLNINIPVSKTGFRDYTFAAKESCEKLIPKEYGIRFRRLN